MVDIFFFAVLFAGFASPRGRGSKRGCFGTNSYSGVLGTNGGTAVVTIPSLPVATVRRKRDYIRRGKGGALFRGTPRISVLWPKSADRFVAGTGAQRRGFIDRGIDAGKSVWAFCERARTDVVVRRKNGHGPEDKRHPD